jgi:hypothetical protein
LIVDFGDRLGGRLREVCIYSVMLILNILINREYDPHNKCVHRIPNPYIPTYPTISLG